MIRIVLDTSVLVSAVMSPTGPNARLFDFIAMKQIRPYVSESVLEEYSAYLSMIACGISIRGEWLGSATFWNVPLSRSDRAAG
jgi:predicted nucleic acid-binding protein